MFNAARIRDMSDAEHVEVHRQIESTNDRAIELTRQNTLATPALIVAEQQTAGRGQRGRTWFSGEGSLTFSWIAPRQQQTETVERTRKLIPMASALAIANGIESLSQLTDIQIKWPNDLMVGNRKLGGILVESTTLADSQFFIVGIGINVNNQSLSRYQTDSPDKRRSAMLAPTSIWMETNRPTPPEDLLLRIVDNLGVEFEQAITEPASVVDRCGRRLAFHGQTIRCTTPRGETTTGTCQGISNDGGLLIQTNDGQQTVYSGTLSLPSDSGENSDA